MNKTDLMLAFAVCLTTAAQADDLTPTTDYSSGFNYYGDNQPFAPSRSTVPEHRAAAVVHPTAPGEVHPDCEPACVLRLTIANRRGCHRAGAPPRVSRVPVAAPTSSKTAFDWRQRCQVIGASASCASSPPVSKLS